MKNTLLFQILLCVLILSAAGYIRFRKVTDVRDEPESVATLSGVVLPHGEKHTAPNGSLTFSDLAQTLDEKAAGGVTR